MAITQTWNFEGYAKNARFVTDLGTPGLNLIAPKPGETILDLGCGAGILTKKIADLGCKVVGLDSSPDFVAAARKLGLEVVEGSATAMDFDRRFDAVFSNAVLHWIKDADAVIIRVAHAPRPGGRFVVEMGGHGRVSVTQSALVAELDRRGIDGKAAVPWYFLPWRTTARDSRTRDLRSPTLHSFRDQHRCRTSRVGLPRSLVASPRFRRGEDYLVCVRERIKPDLCDGNGHWTADYVRLRFEAHLPAGSA
jgi:SAM-dependent methyltransferase